MTILTDSMAREHQAEIQALVRDNHRAREARLARRSQRRSERRARREARNASRGVAEFAAAAAHTLIRPVVAAQHWVAAGRL